MAIDPREFEKAVAEKQAALQQAQSANRTLREAIDATGKVTVWDFLKQNFVRLWPIDAKEQLKNGTAALNTTEMVNLKGATERVDSNKVDSLRGQGWRLPGEEIDPAKMNTEQLRSEAVRLGIEGADAMKKAELLAAIQKRTSPDV